MLIHVRLKFLCFCQLLLLPDHNQLQKNVDLQHRILKVFGFLARGPMAGGGRAGQGSSPCRCPGSLKQWLV